MADSSILLDQYSDLRERRRRRPLTPIASIGSLESLTSPIPPYSPLGPKDTFETFLSMAKPTETKRLVFEACDINKSGYIELEDLEHFSEEYLWTKTECEQIFHLLDVDKDGRISYSDFLASSAGGGFLRKSEENLAALTQGDNDDVFKKPKNGTRKLLLSDRANTSDSSGDENDEPSEGCRHSARRRSFELKPTRCQRCRKKHGNTWPRRMLKKLGQRQKLDMDCFHGEEGEEKRKPPRYRHSVCVVLSPFSPGFCNDISCNVVHLAPENQEQVIELYQQIHTEHPHLLPGFEKIILDVIRDIRFHQQENERLELSYKREKDQHDRHLRQLEDEMEAQMQKTEQRVRKEERIRLESEKMELRSQMELEMTELQHNLDRLQQIEHEVNTKEEQSDESVALLRDRIEELITENRYIKSDLTDAHTNLAILRSETASVRQQFEDKQRELENEKSTLQDYVREQESLTRQLHLLHDANKRLHDTNDDLRAAIESQRQQYKRQTSNDSLTSPVKGKMMSRSYSPHRTTDDRTSIGNESYGYTGHPQTYSGQPEPYSGYGVFDHRGAGSPRQNESHHAPRGSVVGAYFDPMNDARPQSLRRPPSVNEEIVQDPARLRMLRQRSCDRESLPDDFDSGNSTLRDLNEFDSETEGLDTWDGDSSSYGNSRKSNRAPDPNDTEINESLDEYDTEVELDLKRTQISRSSSRSRSPTYNRSPSVSSCGSNRSQRSRRRKTHARHYDDVIQRPIVGEPERMYKVVLAGDCAVGKSSFIMRLCKGNFLQSLNSTLGVDFQTKTIEVDGHVIALQLWDTAGQERFRSIAKSYFRRADGVLLLYDCTYERSFINIREWLEAIEDGAEKKIPIMMVANKTDLREDMEAQGRRVVKEEDGQRLARTFDGLFIESSAKDGTNIMEAVTELARMLRCNEDVEVQTAALQLKVPEPKPERKNSTCCS